MKCTKCGCFMSYQSFYDHADDFDGWRCICCGDIVDDVILRNRSKKIVTTCASFSTLQLKLKPQD